MRARMTVVATVFTATVIALTGCGPRATPAPRQVTSSPVPVPSTTVTKTRDAATVWAEGYCGAVTELVSSFSRMPAIDPSTPTLAAQTSSALLGALVDGLDRTLTRLDGLGRPPAPSAENVKADAVRTYTAIRDRAAAAKQRLDDARSPKASRAALGAAQDPLDEIGRVNLLAGFDSAPELRAASRNAPACRDLVEQSPSPRFDPTPSATSRE